MRSSRPSTRAPRDRTKHAHAEPPAQEATAELGRALLAWYRESRRDLPWRRTRDPYAIWLSEVMLQQTRVETVIPYYARFLDAFPTVHALAEAPLDRVLSLWSGLGYYRRARMLHRAAQDVAARGEFPSSADELVEVRGIGRYTAGAIASIAFGRRAALVDGNVARVLARLFAVEDDVKKAAGQARVWALAEALVDAEDPGAWNQALMELGATVCVPRDPRCLVCPLAAACAARAQGRERELPRVSKKRAPRATRVACALVADAGRVLLARRAGDAAFGGLWEPPMAELDAAAPDDVDACARALAGAGLALEGVSRAGEVSHVLTHKRIHAVVVRGRLARPLGEPRAPYDRVAFVDAEEVARVGTSTFARKLLALGA